MAVTLGVDYGERKVGLAKAASGTPAVPFGIVEYRGRRELLSRLSELCRREGITAIVVGVPVSLRGGSPPAGVAAVRRFAQDLHRQTGLAVHLADERLSTAAARRLLAGERDQRDDAVAAMLVLQAWLDTHS